MSNEQKLNNFGNEIIVEVSVETTIIVNGDYITDFFLMVPKNITANAFLRKIIKKYKLKSRKFQLYEGELDWDRFSERRIIGGGEFVKDFLRKNSISLIEKK